MQSGTITFENIYDIYSPMLLRIALELSPTQKEAEQILMATFTKAYQQNIFEQNKHSLCATLIKLTIQTAHEQLKLKTPFKLKQFEYTPLLHKLLCEQINLEHHCTEIKITKQQAAKQIRQEINSIRQNKIKESETRQFFHQENNYLYSHNK